MTRPARQSKILDIIKQKEIETQEELAQELRKSNFDTTQATISRDIKELGLIKVMTASKKYKYASVDSSTIINTITTSTSKYINVLKELIINIEVINNTIICKTLKDMSTAVCSIIDKLNIDLIIGTVFGIDTVLIICRTNGDADSTYNKLIDLIA